MRFSAWVRVPAHVCMLSITYIQEVVRLFFGRHSMHTPLMYFLEPSIATSHELSAFSIFCPGNVTLFTSVNCTYAVRRVRCCRSRLECGVQMLHLHDFSTHFPVADQSTLLGWCRIYPHLRPADIPSLSLSGLFPEPSRDRWR